MAKITYHKIESYSMKVRITPNKEQQEIMSGYLLGLEKAANMTLWNLREHDPMVCRTDKKDPDVLWPDFGKMMKKEYIHALQEQNWKIKQVPATSLYSSVGGIFADIKKKWEDQGKLPIDAWVNKKNKKGKPCLKYYNNSNPRKSFYVQIPYARFKYEEDRLYVNISREVGTIRIKGWNDKIMFGENEQELVSFKDFLTDVPKNMKAGCRISKNNCDEWYISVTFQSAWRPFKEEEDRVPIGIDLNITEDAGVVSTANGFYKNMKFAKQTKEEDAALGRKLARMYGPANEEFREESKKIRAYNKKNPDSLKPLPVPSKHYQEIEMRRKKLRKKTQRKRDLYQHEVSVKEVAKANFIGIEDLNVSGMMKNDNLSSELANAAFYAQLEKIRYKSEWAEIHVQEIGRWDASSHICSACGYKMEGDEKFGLEVREWTCPNCGAKHHRDENAAINIRNRALEIFNSDEEPEKEEKKKPARKKAKPKDRVLDKNHEDILIRYNEDFVKEYKNPYIVIDLNGKVLDDAQGYGYSSVQKAQKAYKHRLKLAG